MVVIALAAASVILYELARVLKDVRDGCVFSPSTPRRLRWIGLTVILGSLAKTALVAASSNALSRMMTAGQEVEIHSRIDSASIFFGVVALLLAEIFQIGYQLKSENDLTV